MESDRDSYDEESQETEFDEICAVPGCNVQHDPDISIPVTFHKLPTRPKLLAKWMKIISRKRSSLPSDAHVCSLHFEKNCFSEDDRGRKCLKRSAVPTIKAETQASSSQASVQTNRSSKVVAETLDAIMDERPKTNTFPEGSQIVVLDKPASGEVEQLESSKASRKIVVLLPATTEEGYLSETEDMERSDSDSESQIESTPVNSQAKRKLLRPGAGPKLDNSKSVVSNASKIEAWLHDKDEPVRSRRGRKTLVPGPNSRSRRKILKPEPVPRRQKLLRPKSPQQSPKRTVLNVSSRAPPGNEAYQLKKRIVELEKDNVKLQKIISTEKAKTKQLKDRVAVLKQKPSEQSNSRVIIAHVRF